MPEEQKPAEPAAPPLREEAPIETSHRITVNGKTLDYTVTTGMMPLRNDKDEIEANVFFIAYTKEPAGDPSQRKLMFSFNGGPGSSSVWLHLGALGPKRVQMMPDGMMPPGPYKLVDNPHTWLDDTDIVFIDPVGTGYSRAANKELGEKFWSLKGDIESVGEFIRLYLTRYERWASPLFLVGESYGTTRAAGLSGHLVEKGIAFCGILLISSILNFQTADFAKGNDLPCALFLPTYCATAWYHERLEGKRQRDLLKTLREVENWTIGTYIPALAQGDRLSVEERSSIVEQLASYTGLSPAFVDHTNLRIEINSFCKELLRPEKKTVGRLDSRFKGADELATGNKPDFDPSLAAIRPPFTAMLNDYVRRQLGFKTDLTYHILGGGFEKWNWGSAENGSPDTSEALRQAFAKNPHMRLFVASGYYDLATPYFATEYTLSHLGLERSLRDQITTAFYQAGHMMYIHEECLVKLKEDVSGFLKS